MGTKKSLVITKKGKNLKVIKIWMKDKRAKIRIPIKKNGVKKVIEKEYKETKNKLIAFMCVEAVIKYWPKWNPQIHDMYWTDGHGVGGKNK